MVAPLAVVAKKAAQRVAQRRMQQRLQSKKQRQKKGGRGKWVVLLIAICLAALWLPMMIVTSVVSFLGGGGPVAANCTPQGTGVTVQIGNTSGDISGLDEEQLKNAAIVVATSHKMRVPPKATIIALATVQVETTFHNYDQEHSDSDSAGLFQQRESQGWGTEAQTMDPVLATQAFYGRAKHTQNPGLFDIDWQSMLPGDAAQAVQASAYPDRYQEEMQFATNLYNKITDSDIAVGTTGTEGNCAPVNNPATQCPPTGLPVEAGLKPDALIVLRCTKQQFPLFKTYLGVGDRGNNPASDHPNGRAVDIMTNDLRTGPYDAPATKKVGWTTARWLQKNAKSYGVNYIIYYNKIWSVDRANEGWRQYSHPSGGSSPTLLHQDHIHVSVFGNSATLPHTVGSGKWMLPLAGAYTLSSGFDSWGYAGHTGQDFAADTGTPVVAAADGKVVTKEIICGGIEQEECSYGYYVEIDHGGVTTLYAHLWQFAPGLHEGQRVKAGQVIAESDNRGNSTGPHLHFEIRSKSTDAYMNPYVFLARQGVDVACNKFSQGISGFDGPSGCALDNVSGTTRP